MSADLYFTGILLLSSFFFRRLISKLAERNSTKIGHMLESNCNLKKHVQNLGYPLPLQIGGPKTTFLGRLRNLTATLTAYIFRTKRDIDNRLSALTTTRGLLHIAPKCREHWSTSHDVCLQDIHDIHAVSYTHLTLPTILRV